MTAIRLWIGFAAAVVVLLAVGCSSEPSDLRREFNIPPSWFCETLTYDSPNLEMRCDPGPYSSFQGFSDGSWCAIDNTTVFEHECYFVQTGTIKNYTTGGTEREVTPAQANAELSNWLARFSQSR